MLFLMGCVGAWPASSPSTLNLCPGGAGSAGALLDSEANAIKVTTLGLAALVSLLIFSGRVRSTGGWRVCSRRQHRGGAARSAAGARPNAAKWVFQLLIAALLIEVIHLVSGFL